MDRLIRQREMFLVPFCGTLLTLSLTRPAFYGVCFLGIAFMRRNFFVCQSISSSVNIALQSRVSFESCLEIDVGGVVCLVYSSVPIRLSAKLMQTHRTASKANPTVSSALSLATASDNLR